MNPQQEYVSRAERWRTEAQRASRRAVTIGNCRLALFIGAALLAWMAFSRDLLSPWWLFVPLAAFVMLIIYHERLASRDKFANRAISYYERGLARLDDSWAGTGNDGKKYLDPDHVYAEDLDLFGKGSLFELMCTARTAAGEYALASWLLRPASMEDAVERQQAVRELTTKLDLREYLAMLGEDVRSGVHAEVLERWGSAAAVHFSTTLRVAALCLAVAAVALFALWMAHVVPLWPFLAIVAINFGLIIALRSRVSAVMEAVETPAHDLRILALVLERLEREAFDAPLLRRLRAELDTEGLPASKQIARLERWIDLLDSADHVAVRVIRPAVLWIEQVVMAIEAWRRRSGPSVGRWLAAVGQLEALSSMAAFAFEHPSFTFPELLSDSDPSFDAAGLKHPLMAAARCVPNDVAIGGRTRLWIVSGSNMSGKSTLLRAIGLKTVLAWAGAPVAASRVALSRLRTGASLRIVDSLQDGKSRFYAEITRIRSIVDLASSDCQVLFLLDEILSGTNSHDRRIGAAAIVRGLLDRGAIGLITTHDLALAGLERDLGDGAINVHFEDHLENGRMEFDYRLHPGVVERSNALELMRAVGLQV